MNTRRKFLLKGSMATTALLTYNSFKSVANTLSPLTGFSVNDNKLVFIHTGIHKQQFSATANQVNQLKRTGSNLMLLHTGKHTETPALQVKYDVSMEETALENSEYRIVQKGNIKTGIVHVKGGENDAVKRINNLCTWLKEEKGCHVTVCLSQLGYKTKTGLHDLQLANESTHLDIILSCHPSNYAKTAYVARNRHQDEVIINSAAGDKNDFGNIELILDNQGNKKSIAINNLRDQFN